MKRQCLVFLGIASCLIMSFDLVYTASNAAKAEGEIASESQEDTMNTLRMIGVAIEMYSIDHDKYPGPTNELVSVGELEKLLVPDYILDLPNTDAWGHVIQYLQKTSDYVILSYGEDGVQDEPYDDLASLKFKKLAKRVCGGGTASSAADMIFVAGEFCQWPNALENLR